MKIKVALTNRIVIVIFISLVHSLLFNSILFYENYKLHSIATGYATMESIRSIIDSIIVGFPYFYTFSYYHSIFKAVLYITFLLSSLMAYFVYNYHINIDSNAIALIFEATLPELKGFIELNLLITVSFSLLIAYLLIKLYLNTQFFEHHKKMILITGSFVFFTIFMDGNIIKSIAPYNYLHQTWNYFLEIIEINSKRYDISNNEFSISEKSNDLNVILIIGESARGDHFHINGYHRTTTPNLETLNNIISFKGATSCATLTRNSVPCLLTRATEKNTDLAKKETSFLSIFKKLNFNSIWLSNQGTYSCLDEPISAFYREANNTILVGANLDIKTNGKTIDENLIPFVKKFLIKNNKNLLILHTYGSHWHYESHYPKEMQKFKPICSLRPLTSSMKHCSNDQIINSYDNTIVYTDYFINKVINEIKDKNSLLIYLSDHGESLGENGVYMHGTSKNSPEQKNIPIIFWVSEKYKESFPNLYKALTEKSSLKINHDFIFHSILGCSGIKSKVIDDKLNLCY